MRRDFFSTSVASPAVQQLPARVAPVTEPVAWKPMHAPAVCREPMLQIVTAQQPTCASMSGVREPIACPHKPPSSMQHRKLGPPLHVSWIT
jgi:hypothetical protein